MSEQSPRVLFVRAVRRLMEQQGVTFRQLAENSSRKVGGVSVEFVSGNLLDERVEYVVTIADVTDWSRKLGPGVWRAWFQSQGLHFDCVPVSAVTSTSADVIMAAAEATREGGEAVVAAVASLADGQVTPAEKRLVRREVSEAVARLHALSAAVEAA